MRRESWLSRWVWYMAMAVVAGQAAVSVATELTHGQRWLAVGALTIGVLGIAVMVMLRKAHKVVAQTRDEALAELSRRGTWAVAEVGGPAAASGDVHYAQGGSDGRTN